MILLTCAGQIVNQEYKISYTKILHFDEPHISGGNSHITLTEQQAIDMTKKVHPEADDENALLDFIAVYWAHYSCNQCVST